MSSVPVVSICRRCDDDGEPTASGERLFENVKALRKAHGLKDVFELEEVKCLDVCKHPCNVQFERRKRPTTLRTRVDAIADAQAVVDAAVLYAQLEKGQAPEEGQLPGDPAD